MRMLPGKTGGQLTRVANFTGFTVLLKLCVEDYLLEFA
jgi:hypothetical protein